MQSPSLNSRLWIVARMLSISRRGELSHGNRSLRGYERHLLLFAVLYEATLKER